MPLFIKGERMSMLTITLPDGSAREVARGTTPLQIARSIGERLARQTVAARLDDAWWMRPSRSSRTAACS